MSSKPKRTHGADGTRAVIGRPALVTSMALLLSVGCEPEAEEYSWLAVGDSARVSHLRDSRTYCDDCLEIERIALLGDERLEESGPGYLEETIYAIETGDGNIWIGQREGIKVFSLAGEFLFRVGRAGEGPLEFGNYPGPLFQDESGNVHILDVRTLRETIVNREGELLSELPIPGGATRAAPLPGENRKVVNAEFHTADLLGLPLHTMDGPDIEHSFGQPLSPGIVNPLSLRRHVTADRQGRIFSSPWYEYTIGAWSESGLPLGTLQGPKLNDKEPTGGSVSEDNPPPDRIQGLWSEGSRLWVVIRILQPDWLSNMEERIASNGRVYLAAKGFGQSETFDTRIDLIDLTTGCRVASVVHESYLYGIAGDGLFFSNEYTEQGVPQLAVWRIGLPIDNNQEEIPCQ